MVSPTKVVTALGVLVAVVTGERHIHDGDYMALVVSETTQQEAAAADDSCEDSNGQGCQRHLMGQDAQSPPEFVPTNEWQDILPSQAIPPGLYIRVNLETGKKEAKLLD